MGNAITLPVILTTLQKHSGCSAEEAADFIHAMTEAIIEGLSADGIAIVKGVGEFRIIGNGTGNTVEFRPDKALAQEVNSPFSLFEPVDLSDGVTEDMLDTQTSTSDDSAIAPDADNLLPQTLELKAETETDTETSGYVPQDTCECHENPESVNSVDTAPEAETPKATEPLPSGIPPLPPAADRADSHTSAPEIYGTSVEADPAPDVSVHTCTESSTGNNDEPESPEPSRASHRRKEIVFIVLVGLLSLLAGLMAGHFGIPGLNINGVKSVKITAEEVTLMHGENTPVVAEADTAGLKAAEESAEPAAAEPDTAAVVSGVAGEARSSAPEVVTDTVQGTNYLSRIARRHYGKDIFWVYIYEENKDKIQDPNNICPGTVVVIPPADKYGIDPKSKASIQNAERLSGKILSNES